MIAPLIGFWPWTMVILAGHGVGFGFMFITASPKWYFGFLLLILSSVIAAVTSKRRYVYPALVAQLAIGIGVAIDFVGISEAPWPFTLVTGILGGLAGAGMFNAIAIVAHLVMSRPRSIE